MNLYWKDQEPELIARMLTQDLAVLGAVSCVQRFDGWALLEESIMFGFVDNNRQVFLRANELTAQRFAAFGGVKHPDMPYWTVPSQAEADLGMLRELAYEAVDAAHIAVADRGTELARATSDVRFVPRVQPAGAPSDATEITLTLPRITVS